MRHGLSEMNKLGRFSGRIDTPLASEGIIQCQTAGKSIKDVEIDVIVSSPMKRAYDSAQIVAEVIGFPKQSIILSELFMERDLGSLEGKQYIKGLPLNNIAGVEHSTNLIDRAKAGIAYLNSLDAEIILVVSHSAIGRALTHVITPDADFSQVSTFDNAKVIKLI
ncbi:MAG: histidine phosphatase family protein [Candidatus Saccharimonadales bacterium]